MFAEALVPFWVLLIAMSDWKANGVPVELFLLYLEVIGFNLMLQDVTSDRQFDYYVLRQKISRF